MAVDNRSKNPRMAERYALRNRGPAMDYAGLEYAEYSRDGSLLALQREINKPPPPLDNKAGYVAKNPETGERY